MKPTLVADEMFPEGAGPYVELEEVINIVLALVRKYRLNHIAMMPLSNCFTIKVTFCSIISSNCKCLII